MYSSPYCTSFTTPGPIGLSIAEWLAQWSVSQPWCGDLSNLFKTFCEPEPELELQPIIIFSVAPPVNLNETQLRLIHNLWRLLQQQQEQLIIMMGLKLPRSSIKQKIFMVSNFLGRPSSLACTAAAPTALHLYSTTPLQHCTSTALHLYSTAPLQHYTFTALGHCSTTMKVIELFY